MIPQRGYKSHIPEPDEPDPCGNCGLVHQWRCDPDDVRHYQQIVGSRHAAALARRIITQENDR